ncbi:cyclic-phosphate processing receiver domain-containing protein [Dactylosporangium sp. CA-233914]|uniref:cyclic-phosphate processing receiver domain-containing protein n=1 Tax=Dactylosporangium sp. CA-233914 TaxID=3239934 RepID=UPI003D8CC7AD
MRLLVDDLRDFLDSAPAHVARTSAAGIEVLRRHRHERIDELWLDHDLGDDPSTRASTPVTKKAPKRIFRSFGRRPVSVWFRCSPTVKGSRNVSCVRRRGARIVGCPMHPASGGLR